MVDAPFSIATLKREGFEGWRLFSELRNGESAPRCPGVYLVTRPHAPPQFRTTNMGGWYKGKNPSEDITTLKARWVSDTDLLYVGSSDDLAARIEALCDFGLGKPVRHWGGRYIWQIADTENFQVAWHTTPEHKQKKASVICAFSSHFNKPPFANLRAT